MEEHDLFSLADKAYERGEYEKSFNLFMKLSESGDADAMGRIACMYFEGLGVEKDFQMSINWDLRAIELGSIVSIANIAVTYKAMGDVDSAIEWFKRAVDNGDGDAALELAKLYISMNRNGEAINCLQYALSSDDSCLDTRTEAKSLLSKIH